MTTTESTTGFVIPNADQRRQALEALWRPVDTAVDAIAGFADGYQSVITAFEMRVATLSESLQQWRDALAGRDEIIAERDETIATLKHQAARLQELLDGTIAKHEALSRENEELQKLLEQREAALREVEAAPKVSSAPWDAWGSPPPPAPSATAVAGMVAGRRSGTEDGHPADRGSVRAARVVEEPSPAAGPVPINAEAIAEKRRIAARANGEPPLSATAGDHHEPAGSHTRGGAVRRAARRLTANPD